MYTQVCTPDFGVRIIVIVHVMLSMLYIHALYKLFASWQLVGVKRIDLICHDYSDRNGQLTDGLGSYKYNDSMKS